MIKLEKIFTILLYAFFISSLIVPASILNKGILVLIIVLAFIQLAQSRQYKLSTVSPLIILMIFIYGYAKSYAVHSDHAVATQFLLFSMILLLIYPIQNNKIDMDRLVKTCGILLVVCTFILYAYVVFNLQFSGADRIPLAMMNYSLIGIGWRGFFGDDTLFLHFGTVPFLVIPACLYFKSFLAKRRIRDLVIVILMLSVMLLSSSRALVLGFFLGALLLIIIHNKGYAKIFAICAVALIIVFSFAYLETKSSVFSISDQGNNAKIGHFKSFILNLTWQNTLLGDGLAAYYYSMGSGIFKSNTEITILDMTRYFGFILAGLLYAALIFPSAKIKKYKKQGVEVLLIFMIFIAMSFSNPILMNSLGSLVILWYWSSITGIKETEIQTMEEIEPVEAARINRKTHED